MMNIYDFFNSRDIAEHCRKIGHKFTATETAYIVWHSNHHTLAEKHDAWQEIIDTMPDEAFHPNWDFEGHTLHSFLKAYMRLQNEFIDDFCRTKEGHVYTYAVLHERDDQFAPENVFFDSYETCREALKVNELDDDPYNEITKAKITRQRVYSSNVSFRDAQEEESIVFNTSLCPLDVEPAFEAVGEKKFLCASYGFYEMWVAIPTPFRKGDIVMDVDTYDDRRRKHLPFILDWLPYWRKDAVNGDDCAGEVERLLNLGVDWTDMQEGVYFQDDTGEIYWNHSFHYLDLEYYREELEGKEKLLAAVSGAMQGKISAEELVRSSNLILMKEHIKEADKYVKCYYSPELIKLCGSDERRGMGEP